MNPNLREELVRRFKGAGTSQKVVMLRTLPDEMLGPNQQSGIFANLGSDPSVWRAYIERVGTIGVQRIPPGYYHMLRETLEWDLSPTTSSTLLEAGILKRQCLDRIRYILASTSLVKEPESVLSPDDIGQFTTALYSAGEDAMYVVLEMLLRPHLTNYAFNAINTSHWGEEAAFKLSALLIDLLKVHLDEEFVSRAFEIVAQVNPQLLLNFVSQMMASGSDLHTLITHDPAVADAFAKVDNDHQLAFVMTSLKAGVTWEAIGRWETLVLLSQLSQAELVELFAVTPAPALESLGSAIRFCKDTGAEENSLVVLSVYHAVLESCTKWPANIGQFVGMISQMKAALTDEQFVELVKLATEEQHLLEMAQHHYYPHSSVEEIAVYYLPHLTGVAKTFAALSILRKLANMQGRGVYDRHGTSFRKALDTISMALGDQFALVPKDTMALLTQIPTQYWDRYLGKFLTSKLPYRVEFAIFALKYINADSKPAAAVVAEATTISHPTVQNLLKVFFEQVAE